YMQLLEFPLTF
nr:immunoglobulin light chain junction region [Macaca mulatta]